MNSEQKDKLIALLFEIKMVPYWDREPAFSDSELDKMIHSLDAEVNIEAVMKAKRNIGNL